MNAVAGWDWLLVAAAAYLAVAALVRLMLAYRSQVAQRLSRQVAREQQRRREEERKTQRGSSAVH
jgi:hypothetical protein